MKNSFDSSNMSSNDDDVNVVVDVVVVEVMVDDKSTSLFVGCVVGELGEFIRRRLEMVFNNFPILLIFPPHLFLLHFSDSIFSLFCCCCC